MVILTFTFSRIVSTRNQHDTSKKYGNSIHAWKKKTPQRDKGMMISLFQLSIKKCAKLYSIFDVTVKFTKSKISKSLLIEELI